jgi:hypothetical protein
MIRSFSRYTFTGMSVLGMGFHFLLSSSLSNVVEREQAPDVSPELSLQALGGGFEGDLPKNAPKDGPGFVHVPADHPFQGFQTPMHDLGEHRERLEISQPRRGEADDGVWWLQKVPQTRRGISRVGAVKRPAPPRLRWLTV